jgi:hypothetical protein
MKNIYLTVFICLSLASFGQITITKNDMPAARDTARYSTSATQRSWPMGRE